MKDNRKNPWYYLLLLTAGFILGGCIGHYVFNAPVQGGAIGTGVLVVLFLLFGGPASRLPEHRL